MNQTLIPKPKMRNSAILGSKCETRLRAGSAVCHRRRPGGARDVRESPAAANGLMAWAIRVYLVQF